MRLAFPAAITLVLLAPLGPASLEAIATVLVLLVALTITLGRGERLGEREGYVGEGASAAAGG